MRVHDPFLEMAHISSDFFFFVSGECPPPPPFSAAAEYFLSRSPTLRAGDIRLPQLLSYRQGCAPMLGFLEGRGRVGTAEGSMGLDVYGWVALARPSSRSLVPSQMASPQRKFGVHDWVPAPWGLLLPGPPPCMLPTGGCMGLPEAGSALQGLPPTSWAPGCCCSRPSRAKPLRPDSRGQAVMNIY